MYHAIIDDPFLDALFMTAFATAGGFLAGFVAADADRRHEKHPFIGPFLCAWAWVFMICASPAMQGALLR